MKKLSLSELKAKTSQVASSELINSISGGLENACHDTVIFTPKPEVRDNTRVVIPFFGW